MSYSLDTPSVDGSSACTSLAASSKNKSNPNRMIFSEHQQRSHGVGHLNFEVLRDFDRTTSGMSLLDSHRGEVLASPGSTNDIISRGYQYDSINNLNYSTSGTSSRPVVIQGNSNNGFDTVFENDTTEISESDEIQLQNDSANNLQSMISFDDELSANASQSFASSIHHDPRGPAHLNDTQSHKTNSKRSMKSYRSRRSHGSKDSKHTGYAYSQQSNNSMTMSMISNKTNRSTYDTIAIDGSCPEPVPQSDDEDDLGDIESESQELNSNLDDNDNINDLIESDQNFEITSAYIRDSDVDQGLGPNPSCTDPEAYDDLTKTENHRISQTMNDYDMDDINNQLVGPGPDSGNLNHDDSITLSLSQSNTKFHVDTILTNQTNTIQTENGCRLIQGDSPDPEKQQNSLSITEKYQPKPNNNLPKQNSNLESDSISPIVNLPRDSIYEFQGPIISQHRISECMSFYTPNKDDVTSDLDAYSTRSDENIDINDLDKTQVTNFNQIQCNQGPGFNMQSEDISDLDKTQKYEIIPALQSQVIMGQPVQQSTSSSNENVVDQPDEHQDALIETRKPDQMQQNFNPQALRADNDIDESTEDAFLATMTHVEMFEMRFAPYQKSNINRRNQQNSNSEEIESSDHSLDATLNNYNDNYQTSQTRVPSGTTSSEEVLNENSATSVTAPDNDNDSGYQQQQQNFSGELFAPLYQVNPRFDSGIMIDNNLSAPITQNATNLPQDMSGILKDNDSDSEGARDTDSVTSIEDQNYDPTSYRRNSQNIIGSKSTGSAKKNTYFKGSSNENKSDTNTTNRASASADSDQNKRLGIFHSGLTFQEQMRKMRQDALHSIYNADEDSDDVDIDDDPCMSISESKPLTPEQIEDILDHGNKMPLSRIGRVCDAISAVGKSSRNASLNNSRIEEESESQLLSDCDHLSPGPIPTIDGIVPLNFTSELEEKFNSYGSTKTQINISANSTSASLGENLNSSTISLTVNEKSQSQSNTTYDTVGPGISSSESENNESKDTVTTSTMMQQLDVDVNNESDHQNQIQISIQNQNQGVTCDDGDDHVVNLGLKEIKTIETVTESSVPEKTHNCQNRLEQTGSTLLESSDNIKSISSKESASIKTKKKKSKTSMKIEPESQSSSSKSSKTTSHRKKQKTDKTSTSKDIKVESNSISASESEATIFNKTKTIMVPFSISFGILGIMSSYADDFVKNYMALDGEFP